jgi:H+/Cl- antiporter ClcA
MKPFASLRIYPRPDTEYKSKSSLDFQRIHGNLYSQRPTGSYVQAYLWFLCFLVGLTMGSVAFLLDLLVENLMHIRWAATEKVSREKGWMAGWGVIVFISWGLTLVAFLLTAYVAPAAAGSGVAETMGILNGVKYPDFICLKALIVKFFGVAFAVSGGLCVGKEGPLVHMGAIIGAAIPYIPLEITKYFRNDFEKRKLMAVGIASGVSAAFGAPIGGALFAYEISKPNTFWSFSLTWKVFFASTTSTFFLSIFKQLQEMEHFNILDLKVSGTDAIKLGITQ